MTKDWIRRISDLNFRRGLDRIYFVLTLFWYPVWFFIFLGITLQDRVNLYAYNFFVMLWATFLVLIGPFVYYIFSIIIFKIIAWIVNGFRGVNSTGSQINIKIFSGEGCFIDLVRKRRVLFSWVLFTLFVISIIISFSFTSYDSYSELWDARYETTLHSRSSIDFQKY